MTRRASAEAVLASAHRVLKRHGVVIGLGRFAERVRADVARLEPGRTIGPARLRRMMVEASFCRLELKTRLDARTKSPGRCPVCGRALREVRNRTLRGGEVVLEQACPRCPYRTGGGRRVPTLYSFRLHSHPSMDG